MHYFTQEEKLQHLHQLIQAMQALNREIVDSPYSQYAAIYTELCNECMLVFQKQFDQAALNLISNQVPSLFWLHKEWMPPIDPHSHSTPAWFQRLEPLENAVRQAAERLRHIGTY
jgi:hypothetical protein